MEDDLNRRRPQWKTTSMKKKIKTTSKKMEDNLKKIYKKDDL